MGQRATGAEIAKPILSFLRDWASHVTGTILDVDGAWSLR